MLLKWRRQSVVDDLVGIRQNRATMGQAKSQSTWQRLSEDLTRHLPSVCIKNTVNVLGIFGDNFQKGD
jgi:hypothetical protein